MSGIRFLPFVGKQYLAGINGKRVLSLGESHYTAEEKDAVPAITQNVIKWYLDSNNCEFEGWMNTYTKFIRALSGDSEISRDNSREWWERISMYNFVQVPMFGPRESPSSQDFRDSDNAFFTILEQLKPDCVIAWGKRLYNNLPRAGRQGADCGDEETWIYETSDGHEVRVLPITHPSAAFDTAYWQKEIYTFLH